jgi:glycosyltransferase involved in cell wall biosynthesis
MARLTILQVVPRLDAGGSEFSTVEISEALGKSGAVSLVASEGGRLEETIVKSGGEIVHLPVASKNPLTIFANARRLRRLIADRGVDLVHARSRAPAWSALLAARKTGRPFVTTYHGTYGSVAPFKALYNSVMGRGDRVIANSQYTARLIAQRQPAAAKRLRVIYRGIDFAKFAPGEIAPERLARLRAAWGLGLDQPVVLHPARLTSLKGHPIVIEAAQALARAGRLGQAVFILAGDATDRDTYRAELEQSVKAAGLAGRVRLVGHCDDMPAAFALAQVALVASTQAETFGRTSIEAQAMGCAVIVPNIGATPETLIAHAPGSVDYTGWVVPVGDPAALARGIGAALALSPAERAALGVRARSYVSARFTLRQMQRATLAVYDELLGSQLAPAFDAADRR